MRFYDLCNQGNYLGDNRESEMLNMHRSDPRHSMHMGSRIVRIIFHLLTLDNTSQMDIYMIRHAFIQHTPRYSCMHVNIGHDIQVNQGSFISKPYHAGEAIIMLLGNYENLANVVAENIIKTRCIRIK